MEPRFGHDFSQVRVHSDAQAAESARELNALAYTIGPNIVLGRDSPAPDTLGGRQLLAHELAHVVQQATGAAIGMQRKPWKPWQRRTDFKFDSGSITADDLDDDYVSGRLYSMTRPELRAYRTLIVDPIVLAFIDRLLVAPATQNYETGWFIANKQNIDDASKWSYWESRTWKAYGGTLNTKQLANGAHTFVTKVTGTDSSTATATLAVTVSNP